MIEPMYVCRCDGGCKRPFATICPALTECPRCAGRRLLARPVAKVDTATERLLFARLRFEAHGYEDVDGVDQVGAEAVGEFGAEPLPDEDDAAVTALLTGQRPPRGPHNSWLEVAIFLMVCLVVWLLWLTGGCR